MIHLKKINGDHYPVGKVDLEEARVISRAMSRSDDTHNAQLVMAVETTEEVVVFIAFGGIIFKPEV